MARGCIFNELLAKPAERPAKWSVRKRGAVWCVYPAGQCCPAVTFWDHRDAIRRAQELARKGR